MIVGVAGQRITLDTMDQWAVAEGWEDLGRQEMHGLNLYSAPHGVQIHVRAFETGGHPLTRDGLVNLLHEQQWATPPFDQMQVMLPNLTVVARTFGTRDGDCVVREFFVSALPGAPRSATFVSPGDSKAETGVC